MCCIYSSLYQNTCHLLSNYVIKHFFILSHILCLFALVIIMTVSLFSGLHNLENLDLSSTLVNNNSLAALSTLTSLKSLNLEYLGISDEGLPFLSSLIGLTHLDLSGCQILGLHWTT
ncbi:putative leucine-rich repeat domain superfamily [Dioscorea sansibarensis]